MSYLGAIKLLNALLVLGINAMPVAQRVGEVIERSIAAGNERIPDADWRWAVAEADKADTRLAQAIAEAQQG